MTNESDLGPAIQDAIAKLQSAAGDDMSLLQQALDSALAFLKLNVGGTRIVKYQTHKRN